MSSDDEQRVDRAAAEAETVEFKVRLRIRFGAANDVGRRRRNEDHYAIVRRTRSRKVLATNLDRDAFPFADEHAYALLVADGMGGEEFGDVASRLVVQTGAETATRISSWLTNLNDVDMDEVRRRVERYVRAFVKALNEHPLAQSGDAQMGTTWTCAYLMNQDVLVAHVGDSRAYVLQAGELVRLTTDHTLEERLRSLGIDSEEAGQYRHALTRFLGTGVEDVEFDLHHTRLEPGDRLLLCTDGLTGAVDDGEIAEALRAIPDPQRAAERLVRRALDDGGRDNVTAVVAALDARPGNAR